MLLNMLKCKIHRATVTNADLHYEGSISIDSSLMKLAGILEHEQVDVYNITNGERFTTYAISDPKKGKIQINGAAAHKARPGDLVIICAYAAMDEKEAKSHRPRVIQVDGENNA